MISGCSCFQLAMLADVEAEAMGNSLQIRKKMLMNVVERCLNGSVINPHFFWIEETLVVGATFTRYRGTLGHSPENN